MTTSTAPTRTGIYCRISKDKDGQRAGVDRQRDECQELAAKLGWPVIRIYVDNDISASTYAKKKRPEYQALRDDIEAGQINAVISWAPDRLHRRSAELESWLGLVGNDVAHATVCAGLWDLSTPSGRMNARMLGNVAQYESEHRSERVTAALKVAARNGKQHGGIRCFGYEADGLTVRESEAREVRTIAENICKGVSLRSMARDLNQRGVPTVTAVLPFHPRGRDAWTQARLRGVMTSPRLAGTRTHRGSVDDKGKPTTYRGAWPAVLDAVTYERMMAILSDPSRRTAGPRLGRIPTSLGTGLFICGACERPTMRRAKATDGQPIYRCGNNDCTSHLSRRAGTLDQYVSDAVIERLSQPGFVQAMADRVAVVPASAALLAERDQIRAALDELAAAADTAATTAALALTLARQTRELTQRADEISHLLAAGATRSPVADLVGVADVRAAWEAMTLPEQRAILAAVVTVTLGRGKRGPGFDSASVGLAFAA
jgi:site-specific DNA recombinase